MARRKFDEIISEIDNDEKKRSFDDIFSDIDPDYKEQEVRDARLHIKTRDKRDVVSEQMSNPTWSKNTTTTNSDPLTKFNAENDTRANKKTEENTTKALELMNLSSNTPSHDEVVNTENRMKQLSAGAKRRGNDSTAYDRAVKMLQQYKDSRYNDDGTLKNSAKSPEQLQKDIDSDAFDYYNVEDVQAALGASPDTASEAQFFVDYRTGKIGHNDEDEARYQKLLKIVDQNKKNLGFRNSDDKAGQIAAKDDSGNSITYGDLLRVKVAENRKNDVTSTQEEAGEKLKSLNTGARKFNGDYDVDEDALNKAGWASSSQAYKSYSVYNDQNDELDSGVFSPIVIGKDGSVERILTAEELEEYAKTALQQNYDPLGLQVTETYSGSYGSQLSEENQKRLVRLSERYYNNTDLAGLVSAANSGDEDAKQRATSYGIDLNELQNYEYVTSTKQSKQEAAKEYADWSKQNIATGAAATGANIVLSPLKAVEFGLNIGESISNSVKAGGNRLSSYALPATYDDYFTSLTGESTEAITEGIRESISGDRKNDFLNFIGDTAANTYGGLASSAQSLATYAVAEAIAPGSGEAISLALMGGETANDAYNEVIDNGGSALEAAMFGIASGINEVTFEKLSLENLIANKSVLGKSGIKEFILSALKQGGIEASEEVFTEIANTVADGIINEDKSEYNRDVQKYLEQGLSEDEAKNKANLDFVNQLVSAAYGGFVGGAGSGSVKIISNTIEKAEEKAQKNRYTRAIGSAVNDAENIPALLKQAKASTDADVQKKAAKLESLYNKYQSKAGTDEDSSTVKPSRKLTKTAGDLFNMLDERGFENARTPIDEMKAELGDKIAKATGERNDAAVSAVVKQEITREPMTAEEEAAISSPAIQNVIKQNQELITNTDIAVRQAYQNINDTRSLLGGQEYDSFDVSDDGRDYIGNTPVKPQKVTAVTRDNMSIDVGTGEDANATDISFADPKKATILKTMLDIQNSYSDDIAMTPEFVNAALKVWDDGKYESVNAFLHDVEGIYRAANTNAERYVPEVLSDEFADILTREAVASKNANISLKQQKIENAKTGTRKEGKVIFEAADGSQIVVNSSRDLKRNGIALNDLQATSIDTVTALSNATGITFRFFQSDQKDGKYISKYTGDSGQSPNGFYKDGEIYVDINAGAHGQGLILFTASHELTHFMRDFAPEQFDKYAAYLFENYAKHGGSVRQAVYEEMNKHQSLKYDVAYEEVVARLSEAFLRDVHLTEKSRELYNTDKGLWQSIKTGLEKIADRIEKYFAQLSPDSRLGKIGAVMARENREILDRFVAGIREAAENAAYIKNTTDEGGVSYMTRDDVTSWDIAWDSDNSSSLSSQLAAHIDDVNAMDPVTEVVYDSSKGNYKKILLDILRKNFGMKIERQDYGTLYFDSNQIDDIGHYVRNDATAAAAIAAPYVLKRGKAISGHLNHKNFDYPSVTFAAPAVLNGKRGNVVVAVKYTTAVKNSKNKTDPVKGRVHSITVLTPDGKTFELLKIKDVKSKYGGLENNAKSNPSGDNTSSNPIIPDSSAKGNTSDKKRLEQSRDDDYLSAVNRGDMETAQRMVDEAAERAFADSKIRGEDGKLIKVYHGTYADFTVFDKAMGRSSADIQGMFFSPWDIDAGGYGPNVRAFYLNITNPADERTGYKALNAHKGENYVGIKAREDLEKAGYDGVNNSDEEYIAFTSEQIKSADPVTYDDNGKVIPLSERFNTENKDIRYDDREDDLIDDDLLFSDYTDIGDVIKRQYTTHSEAIGEVLKNTADIDIAAGKVKNIVSRLLNARYTNFDAKTKQTLAIRLQAELENVKREDPQDIVNNMIDAVRNVIQDGEVEDPYTAELIDELKGAFSGRYYLTDDQINDLKEHDKTLNDFKNAMMGKATIINKDTARRGITGDIQSASALSLEGVFDEIRAEEIFGITRDKWDTEGYHLPVMLMEAFEKLNDQLNVPLRNMASADDMDYIATQIAAEFTAAVVQEKYNSRKNPYVRDLVNKFEAKKKEAVKKRNAYYAEKMKEIREQRDKKIAEQVKKTREARQNATVQRKRAELKERIRKMHKSLRDMAMKPKVKKYIPSELLNQSIDVMAAVNLDSGLQGDRADKFRQKLRDLSHTLLKLKSESGDAEIDAALSSMLDNLSDRVGNTPLGKMSLDQLKMVHDTLKAVQTNIRNRIEVIGAEKTRYIYDVAFKMIGEIDDAKVRKILGSKYVTTQLSSERFFNMICGGAKNNAGLEIYRMLDDGQLKQIELETRFARMFEDLVNDKRAKELSRYGKEHLVDIGLVDEQGNKVKITRGMMLSLYMHLMNDDNIRHVMGGGLSVPFLKSYYTGEMDKAFGSKLVRVRNSTSTARDIAKQIEEKRGEINDDTPYEQKQKIWDEIEALEQAYDAEVQRGIEEYINPMRTRIEKQLTDYDKEWIKTAKQFFDVESKNELNKVTYELYGFEKAVVKNYFPIHSDTAFTEQKFETIVRDMSLENIGMMKSRVGSANPIFLEDITDVINKQISNVAQYCGMVIPMANVKRILNVKGSNSSTSVMATLRKYDGKAKSYIDKLLGDLVGANKEESDPFSNLLAKARHGLAGAALTMNLKVAIKQAASYPTAAAELGYIPLAKALVKGGKNNWALSRADKELIYKYSPLLAYRSMGYSNQELGDLKDSKGLVDKFVNSPKMKWAFGWIQAIDTATVGRLWYASQYYVDKSSPDLKKGSDEYYKEVARVFNNVVERTQPNYTVLQRPQLLRSTNSVTKMFTMFLTQRLQNFNIIYNAGITLSKMKSDFKNGKNGVTIQDVKQAKSKMAHAVSSQLLSTGVLVGMTFLADAIIHKMNPWRDDDDELTGESVGIRALMYLGESLAGSVWGGSEVFDAISSYLTGGTWYGISANGIETLQDLAKNIFNLANKKDWKNAEKVIKGLAQYVGIPYQNAKNIYDAVRLHAEDIANGQFLSYESGVSRTAKINTYRAWQAYNLGKYSDSKAIIKEMKDSAVQAQLDKGKDETQAKKDGYSDVRKKIKELLRVDYLKARQNYYHGNRNEDDYKKIASITNFMTAAEVYEKPDVKKTLENWWSDAEKKAKENEMTMKEYLNTL